MAPLDLPTWAQLGPQSLSWQMPDLNIWPHLPTRMGVLEPTAELEGPSPAALLSVLPAQRGTRLCPRSRGGGRGGTT